MLTAEVCNWIINRKGTIGWFSELYLSRNCFGKTQLLTKKPVKIIKIAKVFMKEHKISNVLLVKAVPRQGNKFICFTHGEGYNMLYLLLQRSFLDIFIVKRMPFPCILVSEGGGGGGGSGGERQSGISCQP